MSVLLLAPLLEALAAAGGGGAAAARPRACESLGRSEREQRGEARRRAGEQGDRGRAGLSIYPLHLSRLPAPCCPPAAAWAIRTAWSSAPGCARAPPRTNAAARASILPSCFCCLLVASPFTEERWKGGVAGWADVELFSFTEAASVFRARVLAAPSLQHSSSSSAHTLALLPRPLLNSLARAAAVAPPLPHARLCTSAAERHQQHHRRRQ